MFRRRQRRKSTADRADSNPTPEHMSSTYETPKAGVGSDNTSDSLYEMPQQTSGLYDQHVYQKLTVDNGGYRAAESLHTASDNQNSRYVNVVSDN